MQVPQQKFDIGQNSLFGKLGQASAAGDGRVGLELQRARVERLRWNRLQPFVKQLEIFGIEPHGGVLGRRHARDPAS